jgi:hypothetical protein
MTEETKPTFAEIIAELTKQQEQAEKDWRDALNKYDDPTYDEEYEDTLQRKMDEGASDALKSALELLASFDYAQAIATAKDEEGRELIECLRPIYPSITETDNYRDYFEFVSCGACGELYEEGEETAEAHFENCDENPANMDESALPENHFHNPKEEEVISYKSEGIETFLVNPDCQLCGNEIQDLEAGGIVPAWGDTCGDCINKIKENKPNFTKEEN